MPAPLVVEFVGLPGAGKTSVAQRVIEQLERQGHRCYGHSTSSAPETVEKRSGGIVSKMRTGGLFVLSCLRHPRLAVGAGLYAISVRPRGPATARRLFILLSRFGFLRRVMSGGYDFLILDQGPLQNIWSVGTTGSRPTDDDHLPALVRVVAEELAPLVIYVDIDPQLASERVLARPTMRSRFDRLPSSEVEEALAKHAATFDRIFEVARHLDRAGCLRIEGSRPIADNVDQILVFLEMARSKHVR